MFTLKKNLNRHYREQHLKTNNVCCPYCLKSFPRIKEHLFRCRKGILSKIYAKSEEHKKIYSKLKFKKGKNKIPVISTFITKFSTDSVQFTNRITGITEKYNYTWRRQRNRSKCILWLFKLDKCTSTQRPKDNKVVYIRVL